MRLPNLSVAQARKLAGREIYIEKEKFTFGDRPKSGGEALVVPLKNNVGQQVAFLRCVNATTATPEKIERTAWFIGQRLHQYGPFKTGPSRWISTYEQGRPAGIDFDFVGTLHAAASGMSWREWKTAVEVGGIRAPSASDRIKMITSLLIQLTQIELLSTSEFLHGDLSDSNLIFDCQTKVASLIDFDGVVFRGSATLKHPALPVKRGGSPGTPSYIPPELASSVCDNSHPIGDRHARDMLLIELLGFQQGDPVDVSPSEWDGQGELLEEIRPLAKQLRLKHLAMTSVFALSEASRPSSAQLAAAIGLHLPQMNKPDLNSYPVMPVVKAKPKPQSPNKTAGEYRQARKKKPAVESLPQTPASSTKAKTASKTKNNLLVRFIAFMQEPAQKKPTIRGFFLDQLRFLIWLPIFLTGIFLIALAVVFSFLLGLFILGWMLSLISFWIN